MFEPLFFSPVLAMKPWGGRRLAEYGKSLPATVLVGESWEIVDLDPGQVATVEDPVSRVVGGRFEGMTLGALVAAHPQEILGASGRHGRFPLLIKWIDAREPLSVQLHPHQQYVEDHPETYAKTESWYVAAADDNATLLLDVADCNETEVKSLLGTPALVGCLNRVPAKAGGFHHLPAGMLHAIGAGVLVLEVQTPSDTTFRVYDWTTEHSRAPRAMHIEEAKEALIINPADAISLEPVSTPGSRVLIDTSAYRMTEHRSAAFGVGSGDMRIVVVVAGTAHLDGISLTQGMTVLIPAATSRETHFAPDPGAVLLEIAAGSGGG